MLTDDIQKKIPLSRLTLLFFGLSVIFIIGLGIYLGWYFSQDHSIYSKLSTKIYNGKNFSDISFKYPSVMTYSSPLVKQLDKNNSTPLVYSYKINSKQNALLALTYVPVVQSLNLPPSLLLSQIKNKSGDYIDLLNKESSKSYSELYGACQNYIKNINNQVGLLCTTTSNGLTTTRVVGVTTQDQYILILVMPTTVWNAHTKVWQKIESNFTY